MNIKNNFLLGNMIKILAIFVVFFALFSVATAEAGPSVKLRGEDFIAVPVNFVFIDPGAYVADVDGNWNSGNVTVSGDLDIHKVGYYTLTYSGFDTEGNVATPATRTIFVYENVNTAPTIELVGSNSISINVGDSFVDPGATASDKEDGDLTSKITVSGSVNTDQIGSYLLIYSVSDSKGLTSSVSRTVNVVGVSQCSLPQTIANQVANGVVGQNFDYSIQMGSNASSVLVQSNTLPSGLSSNGNRITGIPTVAGQYDVAYRAANSCGFSNDSLRINISPSSVVPPEYNPTFTLVNTKNNQSIISSYMYVGESWRFTITDARPNSVITVSTSQTKPDNTTGPGTGVRTLGTTNSQGTLTLTDTVGVVDIGHWVETVYDGGNQVQNQFSFDVLPLPITPTNTPPVITLIGANPATTTVGATFTDPGATAMDAEDGNITNKIVKTGTVNTSVAGTYTLTYTVTDNGGLTATTTRTVVVEKVVVPPPQCLPKDIENFSAIIPRLSGEVSFSSLSSGSLGGEIDIIQKNSRVNDNSGLSFFNNSLFVSYGAFGKGTTTLIWDGVDNNANVIDYTGLGGRDITENNTKNSIGFSYSSDFYNNKELKVNIIVYSDALHASSKTLSLYGDTNVFYDAVINFEDFTPFLGNGADFSNVGAIVFQIDANSRDGHDFSISKIRFLCGQFKPNTPPVITLIGANPATTTVGATFTDPGATATDAEDGNITNKIVKTGTVNTSVAGTYTLTYTVTDNGGLTATKTRTVVVVVNDSCPLPDSSQNGWYGSYFNYSSTTIGMELPNSLWGNQYGDPLSSNWTANWYSNQFYRFSRIDNSIKFGANFFPFDSAKEEVVNDHDYHFGVHWSAKVTATTTGQYAFTLTSDDDAWIYVDGQLAVDNSGLHTAKTVNSSLALTSGVHKIDIFFAERHTTESNFYFEFSNKSLDIKPYSPLCDRNTPPVITLIGANPATTTVGATFTDPGATAMDAEDGNITNKIVKTGTVNTSVAGTYTLTYTVTDNGGLTASTTRTVVVESPTPAVKGKIKMCLVLANSQNVIATTSTGLPAGSFTINLFTNPSNDLMKMPSSIILSKTWTASSFAPNTKTILGVNDSDCVSVDNLDISTYYYSELDKVGSLWNTPKYNDQFNHPVNNVFDFFLATSSNDNSDGVITLLNDRKEMTLVMYVTYNNPTTTPTNTPPVITLIGANPATTTVGATFTDPGATAMDAEDGNITNKIIASSTVNTNIAGTYQIVYTVTDNGGLTATTTRTVIVQTAPQCLLPEITSPLTASVVVNNSFSYTLVASSTATTTLSVATSTLPAGLSYSNGVISGVPTQVGTYSITLNAENSCGLVSKTLVLTVSSESIGSGCTYNCGGGGGGGGGNGPVIQSLTIFNESVIETEPGIAMVTWNTNLSANRRVVYGNQSVGTLGSDSNYGYTKTTELVSNPLLTAHGMVIALEAGKTYYFRPVSSDGKNTVVGKELSITRGVAGGTTSNACYYLYDYLRRDLENNPVEVRKLQIFLNSFEGASLTVNGIYDQATENAVLAFQNKYKEDILTPWGHTEPTGYVYILTKKKVNEIYCQKVFPVTTQQQEEIDTFRAFLESLKGAGINLPQANTVPPTNPTNLQNTIIGQNTVNNATNNNNATTEELTTTLAGVSTTTRGVVSGFTANVINSGKKMGNLALALVSWPFGPISSLGKICTSTNWVLWILILAIIVISIMWYREYMNNRKIEKINKEIDLTK